MTFLLCRSLDALGKNIVGKLTYSVMFQVLDPAAIAAAQKPMIQKRESGPNRGRDADENAGPTTTVFVGNISEKASDMLVRQLLAVS